MLRPYWYISTNIAGWEIDLSRSVWACNKMGSTTTRRNVNEVKQMEQKIVFQRAFRLQYEKIETINFYVFNDSSI